MKNWTSLLLMAGLTIMTSHKLPDPAPMLTLERTLLIADFPSGSSISFDAGKIYLTGDDATFCRVLNAEYGFVKDIPLFKDSSYRVPKNLKADLESSDVVQQAKEKYLFMLGSGSTPLRNRAVLLQLNAKNKKTIKYVSTKNFNQAISKKGIAEINFEGLAFINDGWLIANRGNIGNPVNHFVFAEKEFWNSKSVKCTVAQVQLPLKAGFAGISGLTYAADDMIFFTASTEASSNAYDDGAIGDSYIGWIKNIHQKIGNNTIIVDGFLNLTSCNKALKDQKIEGICVEGVQEDGFILHLVADNDKGDSRLFKIKMKLTAE